MTDLPPWHPSQPHHALAADVRAWLGTPAAFALFGRLALDQVAYREVAAAVDATGRFAQNFTDRGIRSGLWGPLLLFGDDADRRASAQRLKDLHGQVRGEGKGHFAGERYSALNPALWKWVGTTSLMVFHTGYVTTYRGRLTAEQREVVYGTIRHLVDFDLPSEQARMPATAAEAEAYYDEVAATVLEDNEFLQWANATFDRLPVPTLVGPRWLQRAIAPFWRILTPRSAGPRRSAPRARRIPACASCSASAGPGVAGPNSGSTCCSSVRRAGGCRAGCCWTPWRSTGCGTSGCAHATSGRSSPRSPHLWPEHKRHRGLCSRARASARDADPDSVGSREPSRYGARDARPDDPGADLRLHADPRLDPARRDGVRRPPRRGRRTGAAGPRAPSYPAGAARAPGGQPRRSSGPRGRNCAVKAGQASSISSSMSR
ncbi:oxygenase MpaB family protein [Nocardioides humi]|uniref:oxygenase MpaB family protein n=1 Tax=Nocardioides humi TaxID=449461 RepID=UPI001C641F03|nr:oxygenase MpaB family protein [Nocardioides humi]